MMTEQQIQATTAAENKVNGARGGMNELASYGGTPPINSLRNYERQMAAILKLDADLELLSPKKSDGQTVTDAMNKLQVMISQLGKMADELVSEATEAKKEFWHKQSEVMASLNWEAGDNAVVDACGKLKKELEAHWQTTEKRFRLEQYFTRLSNEFCSSGVISPAPEKIILSWRKIKPRLQDLAVAYFEQYLGNLLG